MKELHYGLVAGEVLFTDLEGVEGANTHTIRLNTVVTNDEPFWGVKHLASAQEALQVKTFEKIGTKIKVIDVFIMSVSNLGLMTREQFEAIPDGYKLQERPATEAAASE